MTTAVDDPKGKHRDALRRLPSLAWVPLAYLGLTLVMTWPLVARLAVSLPDLGDCQLQAWTLAWDAHALRTDPLHIWDSPIFYPYPDTLAYTDSHVLLSFVAAPLIWLTGSAILAHNVLLLLSFVLTGWAVFHLAYDLTGHRWGAFIAGSAFTFCAYRMSHIVQLHLLQTAWLPWALLFLRRLIRPVDQGGGRLGDALLCGLFAGVQVVTVFNYAFFTAAVLGGYTVLFLGVVLWRRLRRGERLPWRRAGLLLLAGGIAVLVALPFTLPYVRVYETLGIVRSVRELDHWSAPLSAYISLPPQNLLYARPGGPFVGTGEYILFPGLLVTLLGLLALLHRPQREKLFWGLVAAVSLVLSLGTSLRLQIGDAPLPLPLPYPLLYGLLPGFGALRVPARWGVLVTLALVVLAAMTLSRLLARLRGWRLALAGGALLAVVLFEQAALPQPITEPGQLQRTPPVYAWLGAPEQEDLRVVLELPVGRIPRGDELARIIWRQWYGMAHWKALPVAYSGLIPFGTTDLMARVQSLPAEETLRYLQLAGVDTLVIHRDQYDPQALAQLLAGLDSSPLVRHYADVGSSSLYTLLPSTELAELALQAGPGQSIYVSADERTPGMLALALIRRWRGEGFELYGPGRTRFYAPLQPPRPGQVFSFGLLSSSEDPFAHGFAPSGRQWQANGLALYAVDPQLRVNLALGRPVAGQFHPQFPAELEVEARPTGLRVDRTQINWSEPITRAYLELDLAVLGAQNLAVGSTSHSLTQGTATVIAPLDLGRPIRIAGQPGLLAIQRLRLRTARPPSPSDVPSPALVASAGVAFDGPRMEAVVRAGGTGALLLDVRGASAYDDRPIHLLAGTKPIPATGDALVFAVDLLQPTASWLTHSELPQDGRYIVYLKDAARPDGPGRPIAKFNIRDGALVDAEPVPLPLTTIR